MAQEKSIFEELAPYAKMVVVPGVTVGNLTYSNQQDLYSTAAFEATNGIVAANQQLQFFNGALGESAITQGYTGGVLSLAQTNSKFPRGQAPANQVYIATHAGFHASQISTRDLTAAHTESLLRSQNATQRNENDVFTVANTWSWNLTIGRGITRNIGQLNEYPAPAIWAYQDDGLLTAGQGDPTNGGDISFGQLGGPWSCLKKLEVPLIFPPLVNVTIAATCGTFQRLIGTTTKNVQVSMVLRGYLMTMPVG